MAANSAADGDRVVVFHSALPGSAAGEAASSDTTVVEMSERTSATAPASPDVASSKEAETNGTVPHPLQRQPSAQKSSQTLTRSQQLSRQQVEAGLSDYVKYMTRLKQLWPDQPDLTISYRDLAFDIPVPVKDPGLPNLAKSLFHFLTLKGLRSAKESFLALQPLSGIVRPREMTLVLAPPGHGKSTLLKVRQPPHQTAAPLSASVPAVRSRSPRCAVLCFHRLWPGVTMATAV